MLLTVFLAIVFCAAITLLLISAVAFVRDNRFFSSAPKEVRRSLQARDKELFYGARAIGWFLLCKFHFFQHYYPETADALINAAIKQLEIKTVTLPH